MHHPKFFPIALLIPGRSSEQTITFRVNTPVRADCLVTSPA